MANVRPYTKFVYFIMFLLLCYSGNPLLSTSASYKLNYLLCMFFLLVICFFYKKTWIISNFFTYFLPYFFLFIIQLVIVPDVHLSSISLFVIKNVIGCLAIMLLGRNFETPYINTMYWLSIVSLIGFAYNMATGNVIGIPLPYGRYSLVFYTQLSGYEGFIGRNSGMFWEPGAFQGYINLALVLLINNNEITNKRVKFVFLAAALLTTMSTTGYLVFGIIIIYMIIKSERIHVIVKIMLIVALLVTFYNLYYSLDFLHEKIEWETTLTSEKDQGRLLDYQYFHDLFKENFLFGTSFVEMASGNGFLSHLLCLGVLGASYYYIRLYRQLQKSLTKEGVLFFMLIIILCLQGEGFLSYPLFLGLPFLMLNKNSKRLIYT